MSVRTRRLAVLATAVLLLGVEPATATTSSGTEPSCAELNRMRIPASAISLPTTGGRVQAAVTTTSVVSGQTIGYCQVDADIHPVDPSAPAIKMRLALPHDWNRKAMMFGGGGYNGRFPP